MAMLLYEHPLSSYAQKVKIALREKGVAFELEVPESFGTGRADGPFAAANPRAEVPVLVDGPVRIFESAVIMEYIEERWPDPPLLPRDPGARAAARMFDAAAARRRQRPTPTPRAGGGGSTATTGWSGWSSPAGSRWCWRACATATSGSPGRTRRSPACKGEDACRNSTAGAGLQPMLFCP